LPSPHAKTTCDGRTCGAPLQSASAITGAAAAQRTATGPASRIAASVVAPRERTKVDTAIPPAAPFDARRACPGSLRMKAAVLPAA